MEVTGLEDVRWEKRDWKMEGGKKGIEDGRLDRGDG